jgi:hypothetical protein
VLNNAALAGVVFSGAMMLLFKVSGAMSGVSWFM